MSKRRKTTIALYATVISLVLLTASSYAWLTISNRPAVSDLALTIATEYHLELAPDIGGQPGEYGSLLDFTKESEGKSALRPVTYDAERDSFLAPSYGDDGRVARLTPLSENYMDRFIREGDKEATSCIYISDFWIRAANANCDVLLTPAIDREDGQLGSGTFLVGEPVWDEKTFTHTDAGNGAQYAVRIGLRVDEETDEEGNVISAPAFFIYEPNADGGNGRLLTQDPEEIILRDTYGISGLPLQGENRLLQQYCTTWEEETPILKDSVHYHLGDFVGQDYDADGNQILQGKTSDEVVFFLNLKPSQERHVRLYIWLEGQDIDCTNEISRGRLLANLQFTGVEKRNEDIVPY